jgi:hypothetical protein
MRQALEAATDAGYQPSELAFYEDVDAPPKWETISTDPVSVLDTGVARHAAAWVAVELH